ncbi:S16 family serine protease [Gayadomonas joobiniege]|uniref:S16 family serine protease n=1 Tax=Gayadomonas joobiniege TaxID=1234606 RepID=UPI0003728302|nr:S16 family serine protease [Gayadomonas joobiniege]
MSQQVPASQLNVLAKLNTISQTPNGDHSVPLLPLLSAFNQRLEQTQNQSFLLCAEHNPVNFLRWLNSDILLIDKISSREVLGYFHRLPSGKMKFVAGLLFSGSQSHAAIPAELLLQNYELLTMVGEVLQDRQFHAHRLLTDVSHEQLKHFPSASIRLQKNIIIYGNYPTLAELNNLLPTLRELTGEELYEADYVAEINQSTLTSFKSFAETYYRAELSADQLNSLIWALARNIEDQHWFALNTELLNRLFSRLPEHFSQTDVELAVLAIQGTHSASRLFSFEQIRNGSVKVDFSGEKVGQINGLTVVETALAEYGEPSRITANIFAGEGDISDVERKADLGGNIHAKAMMILASFVSRVFAKHDPLAISCNLVFEQSYHEVDGDSASLAELFALLSAITKVPIKQNIAVTGAIDQLGNVLAVGGVDLKIEGFYTLAKLKEPFETHAVIIPAANRKNLNLCSEIVTAVEQGSLIIHTVDHVDQACELLTGLKPTQADQQGLYDIVQDELDKYAGNDRHRRHFWQKFKGFFYKNG